MYTIKEIQRVDGELFSELIESTVSPAFLNMTRPLTGSLNPLFYLRINGESPYVRKSGFRNPWNFCLWNPEYWALESRIPLKNESRIHLLKIPFKSY